MENPTLLHLQSLKAVSVLGRGAKGVVFLVKNHTETLALKVISKELIERKKKISQGKEQEQIDYYKRIWFERDVLRLFDHPLLPKLRGVTCTDRVIGFAMDYCSGQDLNHLRKKQTENMFSDDVIRFYAAELILVLEYLHSLGVIYRDLKPENVMIQENGHLMIVDFDLSTKLSPNESACVSSSEIKTNAKAKKKKKKRILNFFLRKSGISQVESVQTESIDKSNSFVGTEDYVAPEIILGKGHDFAVDWWSLGVVLYEMLYGRTPFRGINRKETFYRILSKSPELVGEKTDLRDLIGRLLEKDPSNRISVKDIKGHNYFRGVDWSTVLLISRPPYIPGDEDKDVEDSKGMDVELVVNGIFHGDNKPGKEEINKDSWNLEEEKSDWVGGLKNPIKNDDFFYF